MSLSAECPQLLTPVWCRVTPRVASTVKVFWFAVGGLAISVVGVACLDSVALFRGWTWVTWLLSLQQAVLGILGSVLMTKAVCWVTPAKTMVIRSFQVIISYIVQVVFIVIFV